MDGPRAHFHHLRQPPHKERRHAPLAPQIRQETSSREEETCEIAITGSMRRGVEKKGREKVENSILQRGARVSRGEGGEERSIKKKNTSVTMITYVKVAGRHRSMLLRTCNRNRNGKLLFKKQKEGKIVHEFRLRQSHSFFACQFKNLRYIYIYKTAENEWKNIAGRKKREEGRMVGRERRDDRSPFKIRLEAARASSFLPPPLSSGRKGRVGEGREASFVVISSRLARVVSRVYPIRSRERFSFPRY